MTLTDSTSQISYPNYTLNPRNSFKSLQIPIRPSSAARSFKCTNFALPKPSTRTFPSSTSIRPKFPSYQALPLPQPHPYNPRQPLMPSSTPLQRLCPHGATTKSLHYNSRIHSQKPTNLSRPLRPHQPSPPGKSAH
ncbi:hypothetical protein K432DRAFT_94199 [Lepidopterella palustris CBS 459.81]|uniref:Uncharacterized protein n=1 Tax=Lepidopterella palustris CBS 459.81 TaxID=1314670 RepID=A0A8E2EIT6_9PEZI|nr:hypothetical protein K432DRAFT_94199 [Lepidopterella palustris CBS 459.81]